MNLTLSNSARAIKKEMTKGITVKSGTSTEMLCNFIRFGFKMVSDKKVNTDAMISENNANLSKVLADEKNAQLMKEYKEFADDTKAVINSRIDEVMSAKREKVRQYTMLPPSDRQMKLLQLFEMRQDKIDSYELELFMSEMATNYQASRIFEKIADEKGITFVPPWVPAKCNERLNQFENIARMTVNKMDDPYNDPLALSFLKSENGTLFQLLCEIDTDFATIIPADIVTVYKRLTQAQKRAYDNDDVVLSVRIENFIDKHKSKLATPEEINEELYQQAEDLITQSLEKKKG